MFTGVAQENNHCCYNMGVDPDGDGIPEQVADPTNTYFSLAGGECRSCTRKLTIIYIATK
ncbi:MAG: hypothetical protein GDA36_08580 [Rhodobacteraceae bacterium]|nr:hypothetical protein [Paracoccaceae bacterium]